MRCDPHSYLVNLWLLSHIWIINLVLLGVKISDMIEDICCTWVVWVLWVVVTNFKPSEVCLPISSILTLWNWFWLQVYVYGDSVVVDLLAF